MGGGEQRASAVAALSPLFSKEKSRGPWGASCFAGKDEAMESFSLGQGNGETVERGLKHVLPRDALWVMVPVYPYLLPSCEALVALS